MALSKHLWPRSAYALALVCLFLAGTARGQFPDFGELGGGERPGGNPVTLKAEFTPATNERPALVFVTANIEKGFHLFAIDQGKLPDGGGPQVTTLTIDETDQVKPLGLFQSIDPPKSHIDETIVWKGLELREHEGKVTWFAPVEIAKDANLDKLQITGELNGQACNPQTCVNVTAKKFTAARGEGVALPANVRYYSPQSAAPVAPMVAHDDSVPGSAPPNIQPYVRSETPRNETQQAPVNPPAATAPSAPSAAAAVAGSVNAGGQVYDIGRIRLRESNDGSLIYYLVTALLGGLILNVMPCVLPVIGLKVMSFVQQAGESRHRALMLNVWYSAGILVVFLALGLMAVTLRVGWGDQFASPWFLIVLTAIVFAMALSLMGLWEIPIPGFVGSGVVMDAAHREGTPAAFLKGMLTTVLATPCTGPFMVAGLAWAVKQPPYVTMAVFTAVGLGMASPYLLVGAFPSLIRFLPKPGMWMETFKKSMGLVLLATVVWLIIPLDPPLLIPTLALLVGVTAACGWIARVSITETFDKKMRAWAQAVAMILIAAAFSFGLLYPSYTKPKYEAQLAAYAESRVAEKQMEIAQRLGSVQGDAELSQLIGDLVANVSYDGDQPWQSFSLPKLGRLTLGEGRTVLVDFTADWCATCKILEATVLKTDAVTEALDAAGVVTMQADYTKKPGWMSKTIEALGGIGVPVVAIFPADRPYQPIVFPAGYTKAALLEAIEKATGGRRAEQTASRSGAANGR